MVVGQAAAPLQIPSGDLFPDRSGEEPGDPRVSRALILQERLIGGVAYRDDGVFWEKLLCTEHEGVIRLWSALFFRKQQVVSLFA